MSEKELQELFARFSDVKALVLGDVMIDAYLWGKVERISPEAPVPVVSVTERENRLGGAANVALNVASMGATPIICAVVGADEKGDILRELLDKRGMTKSGIVSSDERPTTVKSRIISGYQHIVRVDEESTRPLSSAEENAFLENLEKVMGEQKPQVAIFEDYNKGLLTAKVIEAAIALCKKHGIPTAVDPKKANFFTYKNVDLFKPNLKELREGLKVEFDKKDHDSLKNAVEMLEEELGNSISLITLSEEGIYVKGPEEEHHLPAHLRDISDVSGAGDTVISVASLCLALKTDILTMAALSNLAGGLVCEKVGVVPIDRDQLFTEAKAFFAKL